MTTIAYRDGEIAGDSLQCTGEGLRAGYVTKVVERQGYLFGAAGATAATKKLRDWFLGGCKDKQPEVDAHMIIVPPKGKAILLNHEGQNELTGPYFAIGSGASVALGAMAAGATAREAVKIAIELDTFSGGEITALRR